MVQALIAFDSTHHALRAEQLLQAAGFLVDIIPTPREITASCGLTISLSAALVEQAAALLALRQVEYRGVYEQAAELGASAYRLREGI